MVVPLFASTKGFLYSSLRVDALHFVQSHSVIDMIPISCSVFFFVSNVFAILLNCMILWWMSCRVVLDGSRSGLVACVVMRPLGLNAVFRVICPVSNWWISWVCRAYSSGSVDENLYACVGRLT